MLILIKINKLSLRVLLGRKRERGERREGIESGGERYRGRRKKREVEG